MVDVENSCLVIYLFTFILSGIELGAPYNYKYNAELQLDKTTVKDVIEQYGKPNERYHLRSQVASYVFLRYYSTSLSLFSGRARMSYLQFRENLLYAYIAVSSFDNDSTKFSFSKSNEVKVGDSIDSVVERIGAPSGKGKCPINTGKFSGFCKKGGFTWMWLYAKTNGMLNNDRLTAKAFFVGADEAGKVVEIERERITILKRAIPSLLDRKIKIGSGKRLIFQGVVPPLFGVILKAVFFHNSFQSHSVLMLRSCNGVTVRV